MRRIIASRAASRDLDNARDWLLQPGSGSAAKQRLTNIKHAIKTLRRMPCLWPFGDHPGIREATVEGYRVLYQVEPDTGDNATAGDVTILRVFGPGMDRENWQE